MLSCETINKTFGASDRDDPGSCQVKGYVDINSDKCYFKSDGTGNESYNKNLQINRVRYYDLDVNNTRALTEYGWCNFTVNNEDTTWIRKLSNSTLINQINIPGTHDSGTYAIGDTGLNLFGVRDVYGRTQEVSIFEQLMAGIRYFDIRIETYEDKEIYLHTMVLIV